MSRYAFCHYQPHSLSLRTTGVIKKKLTDGTYSFCQYGKDLTDVAFNQSGEGVIATFNDGTIVQGSIIVGADGTRSKVREFAMSGAEKAQVSKFPIRHHNMTVCYGDAERARYLRQQFPTSYLALSQRSFHAFQSSKSKFLPRACQFTQPTYIS